jgi:MFS family permease
VYLSSSRGADRASGVRDTATLAGLPAGRRLAVPANVLALGAVSLVTDVSYEMVQAVLPVYLVFGLGLSYLAFGFLDGLESGATVLFRLAGAHIADRYQRRKALAGVGYGLSALSMLGFPLVGRSVAGLGVVRAVERTGKGLRTPPRDALISLSSTPATLGRSFGVHRAMDTVGAFCGPILALVLLAVVGGAYDAVFVVGCCLGLVGVVVLIAFVQDHRAPTADRRSVRLRAAAGLLRAPRLRRLCLAATLLGCCTISDAFVYLVIARRLHLPAGLFPLLPLGTAAGYLLLAVPFGAVADRIGRWRVFLFGHLALLGAYATLLSGLGGTALVVLALALHGVFYAATDGVLMAFAGSMLPETLRTTGLALVQTATALGGFASAVLFGLAWTAWGQVRALQVFGVALLVVLAAVAPLLRRPAAVRPADA